MNAVYNRNDRGALRQAQGLTRDNKNHLMTINEVDAYYEELLKEIKELKKLLNEGDNNGQTSREEVNPRG